MVDALFLDDGRKQDFGTGSSPVLTTNIKIMKIKITAGLHDTKKTLDDVLPSDFIVPRVGDIIYYSNSRYIVDRVIIDYDYNEINVWVKDYND